MDTTGQATATTGTTILAHSKARAVLRVVEYERAKRFYTDKLGLDVRDAETPPRSGTVLAGDGTSFSIYERPTMPAPQNTVVSFDVTDVDAAVDELRGRGVTFEEYDIPSLGIRTTNGVAQTGDERVAWFKDPEGNIFSVGCLCSPA